MLSPNYLRPIQHSDSAPILYTASLVWLVSIISA